MLIHCCNCNKKVKVIKIMGSEVYPHRRDLYSLTFWQCKHCLAYVGCHKGTDKPLGCIPSPEIKALRQVIHKQLDPLWKSKKYSRSEIYKILSDKLGFTYHTASLKTVAECNLVLKELNQL